MNDRMVEVFKTNVKQRAHAKMLVGHIHRLFCYYTANFDLHDCDRILRVKSTSVPIRPSVLISLLGQFGFHAEVLPDSYPIPAAAGNNPPATPLRSVS